MDDLNSPTFNFNDSAELAQAFISNRLCSKCQHFKVCAIPVKLREMAQFFIVKESKEGTQEVDAKPESKTMPFAMDDVAKICKFYSSREIENKQSLTITE